MKEAIKELTKKVEEEEKISEANAAADLELGRLNDNSLHGQYRVKFGIIVELLKEINRENVVFPKKDLEKRIEDLEKIRKKTPKRMLTNVPLDFAAENRISELKRLLGQNAPKKTVAVPEKKVKNL